MVILFQGPPLLSSRSTFASWKTCDIVSTNSRKFKASFSSSCRVRAITITAQTNATPTAITTDPSTTTNNKNVGAIGSKLTDIELAKEALSKFYDNIDGIKLTPTSGGVNNIVQYIDLPSGERELLRIYNNGCNAQRVLFEHTILKQLNGFDMSFQVPNFELTKEGKTMARLSNGADACMCKVIPGKLPKLSCAMDLGRTAGELNTALAKVDVDPSLCNVAPYWNLYKEHHAITKENFAETMKSHYFDGVREVADRMLDAVLQMYEICSTTYQALPTQLIHGDLHYDNVLVQDDKVTALLDFEFAAFDWRALELAVGLSKYAGEEPDAMPYFNDYIDGYASTGILTKEEAQAIPDLINLRILSNIVYFIGRHIAGEDDISSIATRIENYARRVDWVNANKERIVCRIIEKMGL